MLTLIVPGKHQVKNMDVYIAPFIDEMKLLWKGIRMYDISHTPSNRSFMLYGVLCWIIHDFPRLGVCSGKIKYLRIHTHNLFSSQLSYSLYTIIMMLLTLLIQFQGFKQRGYFHVQDVQINFKGGNLKIYINLFTQTTWFFYQQIISLEIV
jgi:hypothetical protein